MCRHNKCFLLSDRPSPKSFDLGRLWSRSLRRSVWRHCRQLRGRRSFYSIHLYLDWALCVFVMFEAISELRLDGVFYLGSISLIKCASVGNMIWRKMFCSRVSCTLQSVCFRKTMLLIFNLRISSSASLSRHYKCQATWLYCYIFQVYQALVKSACQYLIIWRCSAPVFIIRLCFLAWRPGYVCKVI